MPLQDRSLGRRAQLPEGGLGGALGRGALAWQQGDVAVTGLLQCSTHRVLAHGVVRVHGAVAGVAGASARGHRPAGGHGGHVGGRGGGGLVYRGYSQYTVDTHTLVQVPQSQQPMLQVQPVGQGEKVEQLWQRSVQVGGPVMYPGLGTVSWL